MSRTARLTFLAAGLALAAQAALAQQPIVGNAQRAAEKNQMCMGCHGIPGYHTAYPYVYHVPKIGGQQPGYIIAALKEYKSGARWHPSMRAIAASLTEQDMADFAAYYGGKTK